MEAMVLKFVASARAAGMRISTAETLDCLAQLPRVDVLDERQFSTVLRANFAKSRLERARFNGIGIVKSRAETLRRLASATLAGDIEFGLEAGVDFVALSFVQRAEDLQELRAEIRRLGHEVPIIAKLERPRAVWVMVPSGVPTRSVLDQLLAVAAALAESPVTTT
mgnify:CR=1 FL=1